MVRIHNAFMDIQCTLAEFSLKLFRDHIRMMRRERKEGTHKWLRHFIQVLPEIIKERPIVDAPVSVKVFIIPILILAIIYVLACHTGKGLKSHGPIPSPMEKGCYITFFSKQVCETVYIIAAISRGYIWACDQRW